MATSCDNRWQIKFWPTPFSRAIELDTGSLSISVKLKEIIIVKIQSDLQKTWHQLILVISLIHQIFTFNSERNFFSYRIVSIKRAFEFRVWSV
jgi:hypothetical protein